MPDRVRHDEGWKPLAQTALVTGGDGILGSHLVRALLARDTQVRVFVQPGSSSPTLRDLPIEVVAGDLLEDGPALGEAVRGCDLVFHCAAVTDMWAEPSLVWRVNLEGTKKLLEACTRESVGRLVYVGSASSFAFGTIEDPGREDGTFSAAYQGIAYMESKHQASMLVQEYVDTRGLDAVTVVPTFMLGGLDWRPSSGELIRQFISRRLRFVTPGGRNFAYAPDVAAAMISAVEKGVTGRSYLCGGRNMCYMDFFTAVARIAGNVEPPRFVLPAPLVKAGGAAGSLYERVSGKRAALNAKMAKLSLYGTYYSSARAVEELGMPQTPIETAIAETIAGLKEYGHIE